MTPLQYDNETIDLVSEPSNFYPDEFLKKHNICRRINSASDFLEIFEPKLNAETNIILHGSIQIEKSFFQTFVVSKELYNKNEGKIQNWLDELVILIKRKIYKKCNKIVIISPANKYEVGIPQEIASKLKKSIPNLQLFVLPFKFAKEYIDHFIQDNKEILFEGDPYLIYHEDVLSAVRSFKILSDAIKLKRIEKASYSKPQSTVGFNLITSLVDRTSYHNKIEILRKISNSEDEEFEHNKIHSFTFLNAPIYYSLHLGNPIERRLGQLRNLKEECVLDTTKERVLAEIRKSTNQSYSKVLKNGSKKNELNYFPYFTETNRIIEYSLEYENKFKKHYLDLLKLYLQHTANTYIGQYDKSTDYYSDIKSKLSIEEDPSIYNFFHTENQDLKSEVFEKVMKSIVNDSLLKVLTRHPFNSFKNIRSNAFATYLSELKQVIATFNPDTRLFDAFHHFRRFKFLINRGKVLNSHYLISDDFFELIEQLLNKASIDTYTKNLESKFPAKHTFQNIHEKNIDYKINQIRDFPIYLISIYKQLVQQNPGLKEVLSEKIKLKYDSKPLHWQDYYLHFLASLYVEINGTDKNSEKIFSKSQEENIEEEINVHLKKLVHNCYTNKHKEIHAALIVHYGNDINTNDNKSFVIFGSDKRIQKQVSTQPKGIFYHLLKGITTQVHDSGKQSVLFGFKNEEGVWCGFNEKFFTNVKSQKPVEFDELCKESELLLSQKSFVAIRLAELDVLDSQNDEQSVTNELNSEDLKIEKHHGVLVLYSSIVSDELVNLQSITNVLKQKSSLIQFIKDRIDSNAFVECISRQKIEKDKTFFRHDFKSFVNLLKETHKDSPLKSLFPLMHAQLDADKTNLDEYFTPINLNSSELESRIVDFITAPTDGFIINSNHIEFECSADFNKRFHPWLIDYALFELLYNAKKNSNITNGNKILINIKNEFISISNVPSNKLVNLNDTNETKGLGRIKQMIKDSNKYEWDDKMPDDDNPYLIIKIKIKND